MTGRGHRRARDPDAQRGAIMVEFAILLPVLTLVAVGLLEFGLGWRDNLSVANTARAGARIASSAGDDRLADFDALQAIRGAIADIDAAQIDHVVIYESTTADGAPSAVCASGTSSTVPGARCNVYTADQLDDLRPTDFNGTNSCGASAPDVAYCPVTDRETSLVVGPGYLGVYLSVRHDFVTGIFPRNLTITDHAVMRLEPAL